MNDYPAYVVDIDVPPAVLLPPPHLSPTELGAVWYRADPASMVLDEADRVQSWTPHRDLGPVAYPVAPNSSGGRISSAGGLVFEGGVNTGMVAEGALSETHQFTCIIRFAASGGEARSLITVNPPEHDNYLFLSERDGVLSWADQRGTVDVSVPTPDGPVWVVVGYDTGRLSIAATGSGKDFPKPTPSSSVSDVLEADLSGASDLFIGCRSHRKGIKKTLGTSRILDVMLWADADFINEEAMSTIHHACRASERLGMPE